MPEDSKEEFKDDEYKKLIKPSIKETYAILLDKKDPFIGEIVEIHEIDKLVIVRNISKKDDSYQFVLEDDHLLIDKNNILDIERVIPFDLNILKQDAEQIQKQLTSDIIKELDISLEEIKDKDLVYTEVELKEELLSSLMTLTYF